MDASPARKLLLVGWDGADWKVITPLMDRGQLPCLNGLIDRGVMGKLASLAPLISPMLWTSLATGKRADRHGILNSQELDAELGVVRPVSRTARKVPAVWNILHQQGRKVHVINWPASYPAEALSGVNVSDAFARPVAPHGEPWPLEPSTVAPGRLESVLADLRLHPGDLCGEQLLPFLPRLKQIDQPHDPRVGALAAVLAETATVHAAATWVLENERWEFLAVHYGGLEQLQQRFLRYHPPRLESVPQRDFDLYQEVVAAGYRFHDLLLARLLQLAGPDTTVMLVSDHGFRTGDFRPREPRLRSPAQWHHGPGMFCLAGPGIKQDELLHQAGILDVTPTILTLFDLPVGDDMEGNPLLAAWETSPTPRRLPSWDNVAGGGEVAAPPLDRVPAEPDSALAELRAQGYEDAPAPWLQRLRRGIRLTETHRLALVHLDAGRPSLAANCFRRLLEDAPAHSVFQRYLAYCHYQMGDYAQSWRLLDNLGAAEDPDRAQDRELLPALLLIAEGKPQEALDRLDIARQAHRRDPTYFCALGSAYLQLRRYGPAEEAFGRALAIDEDHVAAHFGLAHVFRRQRRWEEAAEAALTVVGLQHHHSAAHHVLGVALFHMKRPQEARRAFETALALRPGWASARSWLARVRDRVARDARTP